MSNAKDRANQLNAEAGVTTSQDATVTTGTTCNTGNTNTPSIQEQLEELKKPKYVLKAEPSDFDGTCRSKLLTTLEMANKINGLFRPMFKDYVGSNIQLHTIVQPAPNAVGANGVVGPNHQASLVQVPKLEVELYFSKGASIGRCGAGAIDSVVDNSKLTKDGKKDPAAQIAFVNEHCNPTNPLTINEATRDILDPFFMPYYRVKTNKTGTVTDPATNQKVKKTVQVMRPKYDAGLIYGVTEFTSPYQYAGNRNDYVKVICLDLNLIIKAIYGNKNEEGHFVDYETKIVRPINNYGVMPSNALYALLEISMLDCKEMEELCKNIGMMQTVSGLPIVR